MGSGHVLHLSVEKSTHSIAPLPSWAGIALGVKVLRSLAAHCSNKVYVSDVNTTCWGNVTSVCNWLPLNRRNTAGSLETRCCFQSNRGQAALDEECLHLPIPGPKRNMEGNFGGIIIVLAHVSIFPSIWYCSHYNRTTKMLALGPRTRKKTSEPWESCSQGHGPVSSLGFAIAGVEGTWKYHCFS